MDNQRQAAFWLWQVMAESHRRITALGEQGRAIARQREDAGGYRNWDPQILTADLVAEQVITEKIGELDRPVHLFSEEAGETWLNSKHTCRSEGEESPSEGAVGPPRNVAANPSDGAANSSGGALGSSDGSANLSEGAAGSSARVIGSTKRWVLIADPLDGSLLYTRRLPFGWAIAMGLWEEDGQHVASAVADLLQGTAWISWSGHCRRVALSETSPEALDPTPPTGLQVVPARPSSQTEVSETFLATYLMKKRYLFAVTERFRSLLESVHFIVPFGGPTGFTFVAAGHVDAYMAYQQPLTEVYSGLGIAQEAGCRVTDLEGNPLPWNLEMTSTYNVLCSANAQLHERLLAALK